MNSLPSLTALQTNPPRRAPSAEVGVNPWVADTFYLEEKLRENEISKAIHAQVSIVKEQIVDEMQAFIRKSFADEFLRVQSEAATALQATLVAAAAAAAAGPRAAAVHRLRLQCRRRRRRRRRAAS